jgi:hypothetical protein
MNRKELREAIQTIAWVTLGSPVIAVSIYMALSELSHSVADRFLSFYISILPLPDSWKTYFMKEPFSFALIILAPFGIFWLLDEYKKKRRK